MIAKDRSEWLFIPGATPAIVSAEEWDAAQRGRAGIQRRAARRTPSAFMLSGHIRCGCCGTRMSGSTLSRRYRYYSCRRANVQYTPRPKCPAKYVRADDLEERVWRYLCDVIRSPGVVLAELRRRKEADDAPLGAELAAQRAEVKSLKDQHRRLIKLYQFAEIDDDYLERQLRSIKVRQQVAEAEIARLVEMQRSLGDLDELEARVEEWTQRVRTNLEHLTLSERTLVLEALDVVVLVTPEKWELKGSLPASAETIQSYATIERTSA